jgi:DnaJ like chaperone protein
MSWWGKVLGGAFGYMLGGPLGAVLGASLGHGFDRKRGEAEALFYEGPGSQERTQLAFFTATFAVMGRVAKADGRVSPHEIEFAKAVMAHMQLDERQRRLAIELFNRGKQPEFDLAGALEQFRRECHRRHTLLQMFLELQVQAAYADGVLDAAEKRLLLEIFAALGFSRHEFEHIEAMVRGARAGGAPAAEREPPLGEAYQVLDVPRSASDDEVKRAYRRLMNQHHPDKLVAKGLPEEMIRLANEKSQQIRHAYERIKTARGMR